MPEKIPTLPLSREPSQIAAPRKKIEPHQKRSGPHDDRRQIENVGQRHRAKIKQRRQINETDDQNDRVHWFHRFSELRPAVRRYLIIGGASRVLLQLFFPHFSSLRPRRSLHQALLPTFIHDIFLPLPQAALLSMRPDKKQHGSAPSRQKSNAMPSLGKDSLRAAIFIQRSDTGDDSPAYPDTYVDPPPSALHRQYHCRWDGWRNPC